MVAPRALHDAGRHGGARACGSRRDSACECVRGRGGGSGRGRSLWAPPSHRAPPPPRRGGRGRLRKQTSNGPNRPAGLGLAVTVGAPRSPQPPPPPSRASRCQGTRPGHAAPGATRSLPLSPRGATRAGEPGSAGRAAAPTSGDRGERKGPRGVLRPAEPAPPQTPPSPPPLPASHSEWQLILHPHPALGTASWSSGPGSCPSEHPYWFHHPPPELQ
jgi:hypothetical protein